MLMNVELLTSCANISVSMSQEDSPARVQMDTSWSEEETVKVSSHICKSNDNINTIFFKSNHTSDKSLLKIKCSLCNIK